MAIKHIILFVCGHIISTDEDPSLQIERFAGINLRGISTNKKYYQGFIQTPTDLR
jgi:hypothetical protein